MTAPRCNARYGSRRHLVCKRLANHSGHHAVRPTPAELASMLRGRGR